jgi:beta-lactamase class A
MSRLDHRKISAVRALFASSSKNVDTFSPAFLEHYSSTQISKIVVGLRRKYGELREVVESGPKVLARLERADVPMKVVLEDQGRILALLFYAAVPTVGDLSVHVGRIASLSGRSSILVVEDGNVIAGHAIDLSLAVGSTFKLVVLNAVMDAVGDGTIAWDQVIRLRSAARSLPTGILQEWPDSSPVTVGTLANLMISLSDNTATDALIHLIGRARLETASPRNRPFLTTREAFILKSAENAAPREEWLLGGLKRRRLILRRLSTFPLNELHDVGVTSEIEWFLTAREVWHFLERTHKHEGFQINPGPLEGNWSDFAYKGGSELGVVNMSAWVANGEGRSYCVVGTWNDTKPLASERIIEPFTAILRILSKSGSR